VNTTQVVEGARNNLNALADTLWTDTELYYTLYRVMLRLARETNCIQTKSTASTVAGTEDYTVPARTIEVIRVTYEGAKLQFIDLRQYDSMNPNSTTSSGRPAYYLVFGDTVTLYPTPSDVGTIKYWVVEEPAVPTSGSTLLTPSAYHDVLVDGLTFEMCPKDLGHPLTLFWKDKFESGITRVLTHMKRKKRGDRMAVVKVEESGLSTDFGIL
jgi:hypothetical protein